MEDNQESAAKTSDTDNKAKVELPLGELQANKQVLPMRRQKKRIKKKNYWIPSLYLLMSDKNDLLRGRWLNDKILDAAQSLLKRQSNMPGLESTLCGQTLTYSIQTGEFVQILHTGSDHWVTISTIGTKHPTVNLYDSKYDYANNKLQAQVASILHTDKSEINLRYMIIKNSLDLPIVDYFPLLMLLHLFWVRGLNCFTSISEQ